VSLPGDWGPAELAPQSTSVSSKALGPFKSASRRDRLSDFAAIVGALFAKVRADPCHIRVCCGVPAAKRTHVRKSTSRSHWRPKSALPDCPFIEADCVASLPSGNSSAAGISGLQNRRQLNAGSLLPRSAMPLGRVAEVQFERFASNPVANVAILRMFVILDELDRGLLDDWLRFPAGADVGRQATPNSNSSCTSAASGKS